MTKEEAIEILNYTDPISNLRSDLNTESITKETFNKFQRLLKVLPEVINIAKNNNIQ
jgi:hypothetical protein